MLRRGAPLLGRALEGWQAAQARPAVAGEALSWPGLLHGGQAGASGCCGCGCGACAMCRTAAAGSSGARAPAARGLRTSTWTAADNEGASAEQSTTSSGGSGSASSEGSSSGSGRRRARPLRDPLTGYKASSLADDDAWPAECLKIRLREDAVAAAAGGGGGGEEEADGDALDLFSLSRSMGGDVGSGGGEGGGGERREAPARRVLGADEQRTLSKLVGCLTKEGKRSRAQRVLSDALHIINAQLRKGGGAAAGGGKS